MEVNYIAIIAAGIVAMVIGMLWYSPMLFGKSWMKMVGLSKKDMDAAKKSGMWKYMLVGLLSQFVMAYMLLYFMDTLGSATYNEAMRLAFMLWLGFVGTVTLGRVLWEKAPLKLYVLNNAYTLVSLLAMACVLFKMM